MKRVSVIVSVLWVVLGLDAVFGDEFIGTTTRWPVLQNQAVVADPVRDVVYVGDGDTLNVFQKSDLTRVGTLRLDEASEGFRKLLYVQATNRLYAACGMSGVKVIDVTTPESPSEVVDAAFVTSEHYAETPYVDAMDIAVYGDYLFVADRGYFLRILDISVPDDPTELAWKDISIITDPIIPIKIDVYESGSEVYAAIAMSSGQISLLAYVKVLDSESPLTVSFQDQGTAVELPVFSNISVLGMDNTTAYCLDSYYSDFYLFDMDPGLENPDLLFADMTEDDVDLQLQSPLSLALSGDYALITMGGSADQGRAGLKVLDISGQTLPAAVSGGYFPLTGALGVSLDGDNAYVTSLSSGLNKIGVSTDGGTFSFSPTPGEQASAKTLINAYDIWGDSELGAVFLTDNEPGNQGGVTMLRLTPESEIVVDTDAGVMIRQIVRNAAPFLPVRECFASTPGTAKGLCLSDSLSSLYVADGTEGIQVFRLWGNNDRLVRIPESSMPVDGGHEVIDVDESHGWLTAVTTDPAGELWVLDVSDPAGELWLMDASDDSPSGDPVSYTPVVMDFGEGVAKTKKVAAYFWNNQTYAMAARGDSGLTIIRIENDDINTGTNTFEPSSGNRFHIPGTDARSVFADHEISGRFAFLADGSGGVKIIELFQKNDLDAMAPSIITTIDTSAYGKALDVYGFRDYASHYLYVLTDNPEHAVLIYWLDTFESPRFKGSFSSWGQGSALWVDEIMVPIESSSIGGAYIRCAYLADGPGGMAVKQVTRSDDIPTDSDGDGISDYDELYVYDTDKDASDSDEDGIDDKDERDYWGNDWDTDTDSDGTVNLKDPDSDDDGMPDGWEIDYGLDPLDAADADEDSDGDGVVNRSEYDQGTDPLIQDASDDDPEPEPDDDGGGGGGDCFIGSL